MPDVDPRLASALALQLATWRTTLTAGARRVGWKLGLGQRERIGRELPIGHLTTASRLEPGATYDARRAEALHADAEVALELGRDVDPDDDADAVRSAVAGFGCALELVDLGGPDDPEAIVAANIFHCAVVLGASRPGFPADGVQAQLIVNGHLRACGRAPHDFTDRVRAVARLLAAVGERLQAGDRIITGSVVQVAVESGDEVTADLGVLGRLHVLIA